MQGKYDKRSNKADLRPEHQRGDYFDALVETAAEYFDPYKENLCLLGYGNHETKILKNHETDLLDRLAYRLRSSGGITRVGGYDGFIRIQLRRNTQKNSWLLYYNHGSGGGGPVTKGMIEFNRKACDVDADIYLMGHIHESMQVQVARKTLNFQDREIIRPIHYVRIATLKQEGTGGQGWAIERGIGTKPVGAAWMQCGMQWEGSSAIWWRRFVEAV